MVRDALHSMSGWRRKSTWEKQKGAGREEKLKGMSNWTWARRSWARTFGKYVLRESLFTYVCNIILTILLSNLHSPLIISFPTSLINSEWFGFNFSHHWLKDSHPINHPSFMIPHHHEYELTFSFSLWIILRLSSWMVFIKTRLPSKNKYVVMCLCIVFLDMLANWLHC